jgi:hypothetical protein
MDTPPSIPLSHTQPSRGPLPNLRGEDETELSYLTNLIESTLLYPTPPIL